MPTLGLGGVRISCVSLSFDPTGSDRFAYVTHRRYGLSYTFSLVHPQQTYTHTCRARVIKISAEISPLFFTFTHFGASSDNVIHLRRAPGESRFPFPS